MLLFGVIVLFGPFAFSEKISDGVCAAFGLDPNESTDLRELAVFLDFSLLLLTAMIIIPRCPPVTPNSSERVATYPYRFACWLIGTAVTLGLDLETILWRLPE